MLVDVGQQLPVPSHIVTTSLRPDLMLWSITLLLVYLVELTEPVRIMLMNKRKRSRCRHGV